MPPSESELQKYANLHCGTNAPDIVRMFGMGSEVGSMAKDAHKPSSTFP